MAEAGAPIEQRHPSVRDMMMTLQPNPRLDGVAMDIAVSTWELAQRMCHLLADGAELTAGLRKLREAKDCLVIQGLIDSGAIRPSGLYACARLLLTRKSYVRARPVPLAERGNDMVTTMEDRLHVAELGDQARHAPVPGRIIRLAFAGFFYCLGWLIGGLWRGLAFCAVSARYGFWQGLGWDDAKIAAHLSAKAAAGQPSVPQPAAAAR